MDTKNDKPTEQAYTELQRAYDWFNKALFEGQLPECLITLQRNKRTMGYFSPERFVTLSGAKTDEIAMNPEYFAVHSIEEVLSTLVHEQCHLWQAHFGQKSRGGYHNKEWGLKMKAIGLMPSNTGQPGGKETGDQMTHYIVPGPFLAACQDLLTKAFRISWYDRFPARVQRTTPMVYSPGSDDPLDENTSQLSDAPASQNPMLMEVRPNINQTRLKYRCEGCGNQVWGKPALKIICGDCQLTFSVSG
ncbi:unnamed protein product [Darwinula stevensoni]|uniref:SprT-like domain-containing protein n=1 Tax=Darwinula stevensoni TaxID=69355 RepID=A0A7R9ADX2_9CRUS|nr:unnamed protein product [Darwinula stevensoni]CAG0901739.1 unnamed protein product [Darwinula stevensoni]